MKKRLNKRVKLKHASIKLQKTTASHSYFLKWL